MLVLTHTFRVLGVMTEIACVWAQRIAEFTARCEKYVGTESGGMDQAISIMGEKGLAKLVHFKPVRLFGATSLCQATLDPPLKLHTWL